MDLSWIDPQSPDRRDLAEMVAIREAVRAADFPHRLVRTTTDSLALLRHGWDGDPAQWAAARVPGAHRAVGALWYWTGRWDNTHLANLRIMVDPPYRRRGYGRELFQAAVELARSEGRRVVCAAADEGTGGVAFLDAMGMKPGMSEVIRRLWFDEVDWPALDREHAGAAQRAAGYELVRLPGPVPDDLLDAVVEMTDAINDAPTDELDIEDDVFSPDRIRAYEEAMRAHGQRWYRLVARERATSTLAGHTLVAVDSEQPWNADQHDTSVVRAHRGNRLGVLLKIEMLRWLREEEPQLRFIDTGNAGSNTHMVRVNEILGYQVLGGVVERQLHL